MENEVVKEGRENEKKQRKKERRKKKVIDKYIKFRPKKKKKEC